MLCPTGPARPCLLRPLDSRATLELRPRLGPEGLSRRLRPRAPDPWTPFIPGLFFVCFSFLK